MSMPVYTLSDSSSGSLSAANGETLTAASAAQDNPVGITKKSIYVIRNTVNDKVYVGQSVDPFKRFKEHIQESRQDRRHTAICGAIRKYGESRFYIEILDEKITNYNEREKYWIAFFNSIAPNGYNILSGGEEPPVRRGFQNNQCKFSEDDIKDIVYMLQHTNVTMMEIASYYGVFYKTISKINNGQTYRDKSLEYPLRKDRCSGENDNMLTPLDVDLIIYKLKNTTLSMRQIGKLCGANDGQVASVNDGSVQRYRRAEETYPIRNVNLFPSAETVSLIKSQLQSGQINKHQIAAFNNVSYSVVSNINSGRSYFDEDTVYPIKPDENVHHISESELLNIVSDLERGVAAKKIAKKYHLPVSTVYDINSGKSHRLPYKTYPIRTFPNRIPHDDIVAMTHDIANTRMSLTEIGRKYGYHKSTVLMIKNGKSAKYRLPEYTYPLRPNGRCK